MNSIRQIRHASRCPLCLVLALTLLAGCGGSSGSSATTPPNPAPLSADNANLIFVVSEDLAYQAQGDVNSSTANLTDRGLQRSLRMAGFLQQHVLGTENVTGVYALESMTHLQTANNYPDMVAIETVQQFALLNQITLLTEPPPINALYTGNSYPINASYASGALPTAVATPTPCPSCQGLDFQDQGGDNEALVTGIITASPRAPGFYVFSAPWETTSVLLENINKLEEYNLTLPASYKGPNYIYAISISPSGNARLVTYNSHVNPPSTYPALPAPVPLSSSCTMQTLFSVEVTGGQNNAVVPPRINTNETLYIVRHADAHPRPLWTDGNYVCAGQWRALDIPNVLSGYIAPQQVYSSDPAQTSPGFVNSYSGIAPALTVEPYAIANNLPYGLAASFSPSDENGAQESSDFFFGTQFTNITGPDFSNQTVLLAWSYQFIAPMVNALISSYFPPGTTLPEVPSWPDNDYDTVWTVTLDAQGNMAVNNAMCEGIDSAALPATCPQF